MPLDPFATMPILRENKQREEQNRMLIPNAIGGAIPTGVNAGLDFAQKKSQSQYDMAMKMIQEKMKDVTLSDANGKELDAGQTMQVYHTIASGQGLPAGIKMDRVVNKTVKIKPTKEMLPYLQQVGISNVVEGAESEAPLDLVKQAVSLYNNDKNRLSKENEGKLNRESRANEAKKNRETLEKRVNNDTALKTYLANFNSAKKTGNEDAINQAYKELVDYSSTLPGVENMQTYEYGTPESDSMFSWFKSSEKVLTPKPKQETPKVEKPKEVKKKNYTITVEP